MPRKPLDMSRNVLGWFAKGKPNPTCEQVGLRVSPLFCLITEAHDVE